MARKGMKIKKVPQFLMSDAHRTKLQNSGILNRLIKHALGENSMTASEAATGIALMRKVLPDLSHATIEAQVMVETLTDEELDAQIATLSGGKAGASHRTH